MNLREIATKNGLVLIVSLLTIGAGAVLGIIDSPKYSGFLRVFGTILAAFGGALVAKAFEDPEELTKKIQQREKELREDHEAKETALREDQKGRLMPVN